MRSPDQFCTDPIRWLVVGSIGSAPGLGNMTDIYNNSDGHLDIEPKWPLFIPDYSLHGHNTVSTQIQTCIYISVELVNCVTNTAVKLVLISVVILPVTG
jgi:hypothetical protein